MTDFPSLYARVCEAEPRAAVPGVEVRSVAPTLWFVSGCVEPMVMLADCDIAKALALQHWIGMMPEGVSVMHGWTGEFHMCYGEFGNYKIVGGYFPDPLTALGEYLIARAKKEDGHAKS